MDTLIPAFLRRQRNQRRLTLENLSAKVGRCIERILLINAMVITPDSPLHKKAAG